MRLCGLKVLKYLKRQTDSKHLASMYDENIDENVYLFLYFRKGVPCKRARPKWGPVALNGLKTPVLELSAFSKRSCNLKPIGNFVTFSFELQKLVTRVNKSYIP